jgi:Zn-dependent metalloprotease
MPGTPARPPRRRTALELAGLAPPRPGKADRQIYDCRGGWDVDLALVRGEADPSVDLESANLGYDHGGATREYYGTVLSRQGIDNLGGELRINVNYGIEFDNAFWDGTRIVLGTGSGSVFVDFSKSPDVLGHELTHGVVQHTANLDYNSQSGALNEHFADVFGSLVEQRPRGEDAGTANWLIGDEVMAPALYGEAIRSMAHPGTACDNPVLGKDPQPDHMSGYYAGPADNQGVHINSGIPNRAFYLAALELGTEAAGLIWYAGLQNLWPTANFTDAAAVISAQARILARDGRVERQAAQAVRAAFGEVGIG